MKYAGKIKNRSEGKKVRRESAHRTTKILLAAAICVFAAAAAALIVFTSPLFKIREISITGNTLYSTQDIENYTNTLTGENLFSELLKNNSMSTLGSLFSGRFSELENSILFEFPCFETCVIKAEGRNNISVTVTEREAVLAISRYDDIIFVDSKGYVTRITDKASYEESKSEYEWKTVLVQGVSVDQYKVSQQIGLNSDGLLFNAIRLCTSIKENAELSGKVEKAVFSSDGSVILVCPPSLMVEFGEADDDLYDKILRLSSIFASGYDENSEGTIVLNTGGYDVFRKNKADDSGEDEIIIPEIKDDIS